MSILSLVALLVPLFLIVYLAYDLTLAWSSYRSSSQRHRGVAPFLRWWLKMKRARRRDRQLHQDAAHQQMHRHSSGSSASRKSAWGLLARRWRKISVTARFFIAVTADVVALLLLFTNAVMLPPGVSIPVKITLIVFLLVLVPLWAVMEWKMSRERAQHADRKRGLLRRWRRWGVPARVATVAGLLSIVILVGVAVARMSIFRKTGTADYIASAKAYVQERKYQEALIELMNAVQKEPNNIETNMSLGLMLRSVGRSEEALRYFQAVVRLDPENHAGHSELARTALMAKKVDLALQSALKAVALKPDDMNSRLVLAQAHRAAGKTPQAVEECRAVLARQPANSGARLMLIGIYHQDRAYGDLLREAEAGLKAAPGNTDFRVARGIALIGLGKVDAAVATLRAAADEDQKTLLPHHYLASLQTRAGDYAGAMKSYEELLRRNPNQPLIKNDLAALIADHGADLERAYALASEVRRGFPDDPVANDTLGWVLYRQGKAEQGLDYLRKAAQGAPRQPQVRYHLGAALIKSGDRTEGRKELEAALKLSQNFPEAADARALLGRAAGKGEQ